MSVSAKFITFSKRENSTKQPNLTGATNFDIVFKQPCSMVNPTITLQTSNPTAFNYCYIDIFSRYYFVQDWTSVHNGIWEASLKVDALASWKTNIGSSSEYVLRAASDFNEDIIDNLYPTEGTTDLIIGDYSPAASHFDSGNTTYVVGIINNNQSNKFGAVQYYAMTAGNIGTMMNYLLGVPDENTGIAQTILNVMAPITDTHLQESISRAILDPAQYIVESFALPYVPPIASSGQTVKANWFSVGGASGDIIAATSTEFFLFSGTLDIPDHPQKTDRGAFTNLSPFMKYWLYLGPFGEYPLDAVTVYSNRSVSYYVSGDLMGNIICKLFVDGKQIDTLHANVKCNFPVAQVSMDVSRAAQAAVSTVGSMVRVTAGDVAGGVVSGVSGIVSAADAITPKARSQSSQGTFVNVFDAFYSYAEAHYIVDDDNTHRGRPLCEQRTISGLSGYILVSDPDISIPGTAEENVMIKNYMANGFYYE